MAIKPAGYYMGSEGQVTSTNELVQDGILYGGVFGVSELKGNNIQYIRLTLVGSSGEGFGIFGGSATVQDSIIANNASKACDGVTPTGSVSFGNGSNNCGTVISPFTNGLKYLARTEAGSVLAAGGTSGGPRGAQVTNQIGTSGTLYGDAGYNTTTAASLWPWPNEARIKQEMCTAAGVTRGFCSAVSLTDYLWSALGNPTPANILNATSLPCDINGDGVVDQNDVTAAKNQALGIATCSTADLEQTGHCSVVGVQRVINAVNGQSCRVGS
jgi:hypothetical protein